MSKTFHSFLKELDSVVEVSDEEQDVEEIPTSRSRRPTISRQGTGKTWSGSETNSICSQQDYNPLLASNFFFALACAQDQTLKNLASDLPDYRLSMSQKH